MSLKNPMISELSGDSANPLASYLKDAGERSFFEHIEDPGV